MTLTERNEVMEREDKLRAWMKENKTNSYKPEQVAHLNPPTNEERGQVELFDFVNDPPKRYFLYISMNNQQAQTWMGNKLGEIIHWGDNYCSGFGNYPKNIRQHIRVKAINGLIYAGTYFKGAGDYARVKAVKQ